jgi:hypothetical protein
MCRPSSGFCGFSEVDVGCIDRVFDADVKSERGPDWVSGVHVQVNWFRSEILTKGSARVLKGVVPFWCGNQFLRSFKSCYCSYCDPGFLMSIINYQGRLVLRFLSIYPQKKFLNLPGLGREYLSGQWQDRGGGITATMMCHRRVHWTGCYHVSRDLLAGHWILSRQWGKLFRLSRLHHLFEIRMCKIDI